MGSLFVGNAWKASDCLELVHDDLCAPMKTMVEMVPMISVKK